jgi:hypothetical protein
MKLTNTDLLRLKILSNSIDFEYLVSKALCTLLDIDIETSSAFGNKSSSLSFFAKIGILLDMKTIDKEDKKVLVAYMEIRNKFMHDFHCTSFINCFKTLSSTMNYLKKKYNPSEDMELEEQYDFCFNQLAEESANIIVVKVLSKASRAKTKRISIGRDKQKLKNLERRINDELEGLDKNEIIIQSNITDARVIELQRDLYLKIYEI